MQYILTGQFVLLLCSMAGQDIDSFVHLNWGIRIFVSRSDSLQMAWPKNADIDDAVKESVGIFAKHDHSEKIRLWSKNRIRGICSKRLRTVHLFVDLWLDCGSPACPHLSVWKLQTGPLAYSHHLPRSQCWRQGSHSWHSVRHHSCYYTLLQVDIIHRVFKIVTIHDQASDIWQYARLVSGGCLFVEELSEAAHQGSNKYNSPVQLRASNSGHTKFLDEAEKVVWNVLRVLVHVSWISCASIYQVTKSGTTTHFHWLLLFQTLTEWLVQRLLIQTVSSKNEFYFTSHSHRHIYMTYQNLPKSGSTSLLHLAGDYKKAIPVTSICSPGRAMSMRSCKSMTSLWRGSRPAGTVPGLSCSVSFW